MLIAPNLKFGALNAYVNQMNIHSQQDLETELSRLRTLATRLDALFTIPGTRINIGLDNILGFLPVVGDIAAFVPAAWLVWRARQLGATPGAQVVMAGNLVLDLTIGSIPIIGDAFDILYNANLRNYALLETNLAKRTARAQTINPVHFQM